jgi:hypothetical protein
MFQQPKGEAKEEKPEIPTDIEVSDLPKQLPTGLGEDAELPKLLYQFYMAATQQNLWKALKNLPEIIDLPHADRAKWKEMYKLYSTQLLDQIREDGFNYPKEGFDYMDISIVFNFLREIARDGLPAFNKKYDGPEILPQRGPAPPGGAASR